MYDPTRPQLDFERTLEIEASLTSSERSRAEVIRQEVRVALARQFPRLPKVITDALTRDCVGDKEIFLSIVGASGGPSSDAEFDSLVREMVLSDELAVNAVNLAEDTAIKAARDEALAALSPAQRIAKERDGTLSDYLDNAAKQHVQTSASDARQRVESAMARRTQ